MPGCARSAAPSTCRPQTPRRLPPSRRWRGSRDCCRRWNRRMPWRTLRSWRVSSGATPSFSSTSPVAATRTFTPWRNTLRIAETFARLAKEKRPGLVTYTTAGDPDLKRSAEILRALDRAGADVLEVGVPFSDPLADGPVIQRATERALAAGGSLRASLDLIEEVRRDIQTPIVIFTYANPIVRMGLAEF